MNDIKYLLKLSFLGTAYHGFQIQSNAPTVAGELTRASCELFGCPCRITGCSRTDAGVHALEYYASVQTEGRCNQIPPRCIPAAINSLLSRDISVCEARVVPADFSPRHDAVYKEYKYIAYDSPVRDPFLLSRAYFLHGRADAELMNAQAQSYIGTHDFLSHMAVGSDVKTTVRTVKYFTVRREGERIIFTVAADGFLYNMVRIMVGTLIYISQGKIERDSIPRILAGGDRTKAGITVVPDGLYLAHVDYGDKLK